MSNKGKKKIATGIAICVLTGVIGLTLTGMIAPGGGGGGMGGPPGGGMGRGSGESDQAAQKTVVEVQTPTRGGIVVNSSFVGTVEPGRQVTVYPKASGEVVEANYNVGDTVEAGDVLFKLDATSLQLDIAQTQANLKTAQARAELSVETAQQNLETAQQNLNNYANNIDDGLNSSLLQAEASVKSAELSLQQANVDYRTTRQNYNDYINDEWEGDYSNSTRDSLRNAKVQAELKVESAQLSLENAKASLEAVKKQVEEQKTTTETSVKTAETNVKSAELGTDFTADNISLQKLQNSLADYTVKAPIGGVIEQKNIDVYDTVSMQIAAYVISNKDSISVSFDVAESALAYLSPGDAVTLEKNGETYPGTITEVSTMVNSASGLYTVKATVENAPFELRSGSTVKLRAETQKVENEMVIPIDAVYYDNGSPYVFVFEQGAAHKVDVDLGISDEKYIHVKSGLSMSDEVIVTYSANLYDGAEVYLPETVPQEDVGEAGSLPEGGELPDGLTAPNGAPPARPGDESNIPDGLAPGSATQESGDGSSLSSSEEEAA